MISQGKIGPRSVVIITALSISISCFYASSIAADYGGYAAWLVILLAGLVALALSFFPARLMRSFPDSTIIEVCYQVLGKYLGFLVGLIFAGHFLLEAALSLRLGCDRILTSYMPNTPLSVMMLAMLSVGLAGAYLGLEAVARAIVIAFGLLLFTLFFPILVSVNFMDYLNLFPLLGAGLPAVALGGVSMVGMFSDVLLISVIYPSISKFKDGRVNVWAPSIWWALVILLFTTIGAQLIFPPTILTENLFPLVQVTRLVYLGRFFQRIDAFLAFFWIGAYGFRYALVLLLAANVLAQLLRLPYYRPLLISLGVIAFAIGMIPHDMIETTYIVTSIFWRTGWLIAFVLPGILLLVSYFRRGVNNG